MKDFVLCRPNKPIKIVEENKIQRKRPFQVVTQPMSKEYGEVAPKRRRLEGYRSVPFGYVD